MVHVVRFHLLGTGCWSLGCTVLGTGSLVVPRDVGYEVAQAREGLWSSNWTWVPNASDT